MLRHCPGLLLLLRLFQMHYMKFNIDTKEKFTVITPTLASLDDNVTVELEKALTDCLARPPRNVIVNLSGVAEIAVSFIDSLVKLREHFYNNNASLVTCCPKKQVLVKIKQMEAEDLLNLTLTESEAWDIVQMEEIERELDAAE